MNFNNTLKNTFDTIVIGQECLSHVYFGDTQMVLGVIVKNSGINTSTKKTIVCTLLVGAHVSELHH